MDGDEDLYKVVSKNGQVTLTRCMFHCAYCRKWFPASEVGLRSMGDGTVRNQPRCGPCRKKK